ncbi:Hypothetical protein LUCI_5191 [Lucifera butyrica]|uniref:Auxin efflux carrier n=1 Tax=Lucifera butyrica TaxID=1351585 RepID=A0A498RIG8_9FIRM|nr:transporter [Lucifera butyrica]VBB09893.1 Hypothetical protein LUCI_5191 [Lucifera butyrica]
MDVKIKILYFAFDLLVPLLLGYCCRRRHWFHEQVFDRMITVNILLITPVLALLSFWVLKPDWQLVWLPVLGVGVSIIPGIIAYRTSRRKYGSELDRGSYLLSAMLSNMGTLGGLCAFFLFGETGYAYTQLMTMFFNVVVFAFCFPLAQYCYMKEQKEGSLKLSLAAIVWNRNQLPVVGLAAGLTLLFLGWPRPAVLGAAFDPLVHISAWTQLIPVGYAINFSEMRKYYRGILDLIPIKFVVTPVIIYALARPIIKDTTVLYTALVLASTPPAINSVVTAKIHHLNVNIAMAAFILLTALFLTVIYPLFFWYLAV